jgi:ABC-2 type transport system permease protein
MRKFWLVFRYEYVRHVIRKRFIFAVLSMPLFMGAILGIGVVSVLVLYDPGPVGYVDHSGLLSSPIQLEESKRGLFPPIKILSFETEEGARTALDAGEIKGFYIVGEDYPATGKLSLLAVKPLADNIREDFSSFLRQNLIRSLPSEDANRLVKGAEIEVQSKDGKRTTSGGMLLNFIMPFVIGIFFMISVNTSGGYVVQALVEEKENRTMEVVVTSVSPGQLMTGKVLGDIAVGLTQLIAWILTGVLIVILGKDVFQLPEGFALDWGFLGLTFLTLLPAFVMVSALMATIGATAVERTEAQQVAGMFTLPIVMPFWFLWSIMEFPNSPLAVGLSIFPLTSPISLPLRATSTEIPAWEIVLSVSLLVLCAAGALWLAGRTFRLGMLRYGKSLSLREVLHLRAFRAKAKEETHG